MKLDMLGRLRNMDLPDGKTAVLYSVYEAVSNSIHAINDRFGHEETAQNGVVEVDIELNRRGEVQTIDVSDNGVGFTPDNLDSFDTSDSRYKYHPVDQVLGYIEELRSNTAKDVDGEIVCDINATTPFNCFIVCELTDATRRMIERTVAQTMTPDGEGYYGWSTPHNAFIQVVSFKKMLRDAYARSRVYFEALRLEKPSAGARKRAARARDKRAAEGSTPQVRQ